MIVIESIQIGRIVTAGDLHSSDAMQRQWTSAFCKSPVNGPVAINEQGIIGDAVADIVHHGGVDKSILCYASDHYRDWSIEHPELSFSAGGFGENLTLAGVVEADVCIGDCWSAGECEFQISQPRQPCWKISRRWQVKTMTKEVANTGRTGWYLRTLRGGTLRFGMEMLLTRRPHPNWTVARANDVLFGRETDGALVAELMNLDELSGEWKQALS